MIRLRRRQTNPTCTTLTCERSRFWRDQHDGAANDRDRYANQLHALGVVPEPAPIDPSMGPASWGSE